MYYIYFTVWTKDLFANVEGSKGLEAANRAIDHFLDQRDIDNKLIFTEVLFNFMCDTILPELYPEGRLNEEHSRDFNQHDMKICSIVKGQTFEMLKKVYATAWTRYTSEGGAIEDYFDEKACLFSFSAVWKVFYKKLYTLCKHKMKKTVKKRGVAKLL
jgi:hypothetical protein